MESKFNSQIKGQLLSQDQEMRDLQKDYEKKIEGLKLEGLEKDRINQRLKDKVSELEGNGAKVGEEGSRLRKKVEGLEE